jgi:hypothetical protein
MPSIERADPVILGHILAGHRELHEQMMAARAAFAASGAGTAEHVQAARDRLGALRDHLGRHFAQEEEGGYLEESLNRMPRLNHQVKAVLADHPALLAELDGLIERLSRPDIRRVSWEQAHRDFDAFAQHLVAHERNENAVVQEGYNEDLGLTD